MCKVPPTILPPRFWARIFKRYGASESIPPAIAAWRAGTEIGLFYQHDRLHRLAESIPGRIKRLQIRALVKSLILPTWIESVFFNRWRTYMCISTHSAIIHRSHVHIFPRLLRLGVSTIRDAYTIRDVHFKSRSHTRTLGDYNY